MRLQSLIEAQRVGRGQRRRPARPDAADQDHSPRRLLDLHRGEEKTDVALVEEQPQLLQPLGDGQAQSERPELAPGFEDQDLEASLKLLGDRGPARAAADDDRGAHQSASGKEKRARQRPAPSVRRSENASSPPPASPARTPASKRDIRRHTPAE